MNMNDKITLNPVGRLSEIYGDSAILRALISLLPSSGPVSTFLQERADEIKTERLRIFFDHLAEGKIPLTEELIQTEDFLHCYTKTVRAVADTRRREKIQLFSRLFSNSMLTDLVSDPDEYEFLLSVVDDLSPKEIAVLQAIEEYENRYYNNGRFVSEQRSEGLLQPIVEEKLGLERGQLSGEKLMGIVIRLNRTGCYTMMGWRKGPAQDCRLTEIYFKLKKLVLDEGDSVSNKQLNSTAQKDAPQVS